MALTNDYLSVWELAHRLGDFDPDKRSLRGLPMAVKENIRLLMNEILDSHLDSTLIMEKRRKDSDLPPELYIRHHLDEIYACIDGHRYAKRLLKFVEIDKGAFAHWCMQSGHPLPEFWYSYAYQVPDRELEVFDEHTEEHRKPTPSQAAKLQCLKVATTLWQKSPDMRIAEVAREIQDQGIAGHFQQKTVVNWIRQAAPEAVRNRPGRPRK